MVKPSADGDAELKNLISVRSQENTQVSPVNSGNFKSREEFKGAGVL